MLKRFIGRFLCLFFGHNPSPITFTNPSGQGELFVIALGQGPDTVAVVLNVCTRCEEPARDRTRGALMTEKIRGHIAGEAKAKAEIEAATKAKAEAQRKPGESIKAWRARTGLDKRPLAAVPKIHPQEPSEVLTPAESPKPEPATKA